VRVEWWAVPTAVRVAFEAWAGSPVVQASSQASGFSPGVAAILQVANGQRWFVKAVGSELNADSPVFHRREARIAAALPEHVPAPRLRWSYDNDGWVVLAFDVVRGHHPKQPWRDDELDLVLHGLYALSMSLTPSPIRDVRSASDAVEQVISGWRQLRHKAPEGLDAWSSRHLEELAELEDEAPAAVSGETLLHFDVRADNILVDEGHVWFFDWPHACTGAAWIDVIAFAPSVAMQGGPEPEVLLRRYPGSAEADPRAVTAAVAAVAGFFTRHALLPPPPGLPTLRAFQAGQGTIARRWLAERTGWPP
jgi:hypothetical protein